MSILGRFEGKFSTAASNFQNIFTLCELFAERNLDCTVICESDGTQAEDASAMKKAYLGYLK